MLVELIPYTDDERLPPAVRIACLEDWFTNYRLLIEFLVLKPPKNCAGATSFVTDWKVETSRSVQRLRADYGFASEHVTHIGHLKPGAPVQNLAPQLLAIHAVYVLEVAEEFVDAMAADDNPYHSLIHTAVTAARQRLHHTK